MTPDDIRALGEDIATAIRGRGQTLADVLVSLGKASEAKLLTGIFAQAANTATLRCNLMAIGCTQQQMAARRDAQTPRPLAEWNEDIGDVLWWRFPIEEPPYVGSPLDKGRNVEVVVEGQQLAARTGGWPGYHTHWTPIPMPEPPA